MAIPTLRDSLLPALDQIRAIPGMLGLRRYTVAVFRPATLDQKAVTVALGTFNPKVAALTADQVARAGGLYALGDYRVGPITPPYAGSTANNAGAIALDPLGSTETELLFMLSGAEFGTGTWFQKISATVTPNFHYTFVIRRTAKLPDYP